LGFLFTHAFLVQNGSGVNPYSSIFESLL
jgi:hypothetical protein